MKRTLLAGLIAGALAWTGVAAAQVPPTVTFSARVTDGDANLQGAHALTFRLFDAAMGGNQRWSESYPQVEVDDGLVAVALGSQAPLTTAVLGSGPLWVEIVLDGATMSPRLPLRSVPYAVRAGDASSLGGQPSTSFAPATHNHDVAYVNGDGDTMTGVLDVGADVRLHGKVAFRGSDSWLRLNQDGEFTSGIHSPRNLNVSGLTIGQLYFDPGDGNLDMAGYGYLRGGARLNNIAIGAQPFGAVPFPYETIQLDPGNNLRIAFGTTERMRLEAGGALRMAGATTDCRNGWNCNGFFWDMSVSSVLYSGMSQRSDARLKEDVEPEQDGLATVRKLRPVTFRWKDPARGADLQHGWIAQEVRQVLPELVATGDDGMLSLDTPELVPVLMQAVKELDAENAALKRRLDALERKAEGGSDGRGSSAIPPAGPGLPPVAWLGLGLLLAIVGWAARRMLRG